MSTMYEESVENVKQPQTRPLPKNADDPDELGTTYWELRPDEVEEFEESEEASPPEDSVRLYLTEMGSVPLLNKKGEVALARRMERGARRVADGSHVILNDDAAQRPLHPRRPRIAGYEPAARAV